jgi:hypothetical protein
MLRKLKWQIPGELLAARRLRNTGLRPLIGIASSNSARAFCVDRSLCDGWSFVQRSPQCNCEASIIRMPWPIKGCCVTEKNKATSVAFVNPVDVSYFLGQVCSFSWTAQNIYLPPCEVCVVRFLCRRITLDVTKTKNGGKYRFAQR